ncbi:uncharacterized protein TNCV_2292141 [Trichonephila clavipes]|uniref:Uncharacterized protein n=1 Tax=Trichonephila clavipes TaxID=2585209 RepID=A0A8X6RJA4_TRICX|nr:uncharacterized protein TNCV_2292141 [Trichonephila clavipes]
MVSWEYLWPTLRCRRVAGVSPLLSIGWWYLSSVSPKRHCCRVSAADKGCRVYPLDPRPDAVALYSGCTLDCPLTASPHKSLSSSRGVISEPDLLCTSDAEILEEFSDQDVVQTDENITKVKCPPLKLLQQPSSLPKPNISPSIPSTSASSVQADLCAA